MLSDDERMAMLNAMAMQGGCASPYAYTAGFAAGIAYAQTWRSMESAPEETEVLFWIVPREPHECYHDTSGKPITATFPPHIHRGKARTWSGLAKATHWMPLPLPPTEGK